MSTPLRLAGFVAALVALFGVGLAIGRAVDIDPPRIGGQPSTEQAHDGAHR